MALPDLSKLDHHNEAAMALQIYRLQNENSGSDSIQVFYKGCVFNLNFVNGSVSQEMMKTGAVHSKVKSELANEYAEQIKVALSLAADIKLLDLIKSIDDTSVQKIIQNATARNPQASAAYILTKLVLKPNDSLTTRISFFAANQVKDSAALSVVRDVLKKTDIYSVTTLGAVDAVWKEINSRLQTDPKLKSFSNK